MIGDRGDVRVVPADRKADNGSSDDVINVDLTRARFLADPAALWRHAYAEFGRLLRRDFWNPGMSGVDWDGVLEEYRFLLDRVRTSAEFGDLLWEVAGELGTSHAYVYAVGHVLRQVGAARPARGAARRRRGPGGRTGAGSWSGCCPASRPTRGPARRSPPPASPSGRATRSSPSTAARSTRCYGPWPALAGTHGKPVELTIKPADPSLVPRPPALAEDDKAADSDKEKDDAAPRVKDEAKEGAQTASASAAASAAEPASPDEPASGPADADDPAGPAAADDAGASEVAAAEEVAAAVDAALADALFRRDGTAALAALEAIADAGARAELAALADAGSPSGSAAVSDPATPDAATRLHA